VLIARIAALAAATLAAGCASAGSPPTGSPVQGISLASLGEEVRLGGLSVRPLRIEEDSRCPASVQCIQAGTVRLAVRLVQAGRSRETVLRLGVAEPLGGGRFLWLVAACPYPARPGPIAPRAYHFLLAAGADMRAMPPDHDCGPN
jgi:hypothetical protein